VTGRLRANMTNEGTEACITNSIGVPLHFQLSAFFNVALARDLPGTGGLLLFPCVPLRLPRIRPMSARGGTTLP